MSKLTIKNVLDIFATHQININRGGRWRTDDNLCPLQAATGMRLSYMSRAAIRGLDEISINLLIHWADTRKWTIFYNPMDENPEFYNWYGYKG